MVNTMVQQSIDRGGLTFRPPCARFPLGCKGKGEDGESSPGIMMGEGDVTGDILEKNPVDEIPPLSKPQNSQKIINFACKSFKKAGFSAAGPRNSQI